MPIYRVEIINDRGETDVVEVRAPNEQEARNTVSRKPAAIIKRISVEFKPQ